jgi:hypothetical protein
VSTFTDFTTRTPTARPPRLEVRTEGGFHIPSPREPTIDLVAALGGLIEVYGRQEAAECWIFGGWLSRAWMAMEGANATARFDRGVVSADARLIFFEREDVGPRGVGFMLVLPTPQRRLGRMLGLALSQGDDALEIVPASDIRELPDRAIADYADDAIARCIPWPTVAETASLIARRFVGEGYVDAYGFHSPSAGWFVCGWISNDWIAHADQGVEVVAQFERGQFDGAVTLNYFEREDISGKGLGVILHLANSKTGLGRMLNVTLRAGRAVVIARPAGVIEMIAGDAIAASLFPLLEISDPGPAKDALRELAARAAFEGHDTLGKLRDLILLDFDEAIACAPDCVILLGWLLARPGAVKAVRLRSGEHVFAADLETGIHWIDRADVIEGVGREHGFDDPRCGFILRIPTGQPLGETLHLEVETSSGEIGFKTLPRPRLAGLPAMKRLLSIIDTQFADVDRLYDHILGPAITALNARRLSAPPQVATRQFGPAVAAPRHSVIVPLYGRIDFMEMQLALFATLGLGADVELIYVLDDPPKTRETQVLAASLYERFRIPFRLLCLSHNLGFAPANNVGVRAATGEYICCLEVFHRQCGEQGPRPERGALGAGIFRSDDAR